jgi:NADP-dependent 3-hydroxy acid dehydrogenase YdfG
MYPMTSPARFSVGSAPCGEKPRAVGARLNEDLTMQPLTGQSVLLTGGGSGIGAAIARKLLAAETNIIVTGRTEAKLKELCSANGNNPRLHYRVCDGADPAQVEACMTWTLEQFGGKLSLLINNAGVNLKDRSARKLTPETWRYTLQANLDSAYFFIRAALPAMTAQGGGLIININSIAGKRATKLSGAAYCASKFAMAALSDCVRVEERENGIRTTSIFPGEVDTPILEHRPEPVPPERRKLILQPDDVAEAVLFVASLPPRVSIPELIITPAAQPFA